MYKINFTANQKKKVSFTPITDFLHQKNRAAKLTSKIMPMLIYPFRFFKMKRMRFKPDEI